MRPIRLMNRVLLRETPGKHTIEIRELLGKHFRTDGTQNVFKRVQHKKWQALIIKACHSNCLIVRCSKRLFEVGLRRGYAGYGHAEGRAAHVVHAEFGAEDYGGGFAAVLAADTDFEFGLDAAAFLYAHADELAYADLVEYFEGIGLDYAVFLVEFEEFGSVVAREAEGHLGQVVGAEGEEVGNLSDFVGGEGSAAPSADPGRKIMSACSG